MSSDISFRCRLSDILLLLAAVWIFSEIRLFSVLQFTYIVCLILVLVSLLKVKIVIRRGVDVLPLGFTLIYIYGVGVGLYHGNNPVYVVSNFAGMFLCVPLYYLVVSKMSIVKIYKFSQFTAYIYLLCVMLAYIAALIFGDGFVRELSRLYGIRGLGSQSAEGASYMLSNSSWVFILIFTSVYSVLSGRFFFDNKKLGFSGFLRVFLVLFSSIYLMIVVSDSKGFLLSFIVGVSLVSLSMLNESKRRVVSFLMYLSFCFLLLILLVGYGGAVSDLVKSIFNLESSGNNVRYEQVDIVLDRFAFFGNGLGAEFDSYMRYKDRDSGYGIELTYLNLIDKLGLFGFIVGVIYFYLYFRYVILLFTKNFKRIGILGLGLLSFIWPSIGNPMLFSVSYIIALLFSIRVLVVLGRGA